MIKLKELLEGNNDYFKTAGEAVDFAKAAAEKKGFTIDEDEISDPYDLAI